MNYPGVPTTMAAEGLPRRGFTVAELEQMVAGGILAEDERIELIDRPNPAIAPSPSTRPASVSSRKPRRRSP